MYPFVKELSIGNNSKIRCASRQKGDKWVPSWVSGDGANKYVPSYKQTDQHRVAPAGDVFSISQIVLHESDLNNNDLLDTGPSMDNWDGSMSFEISTSSNNSQLTAVDCACMNPIYSTCSIHDLTVDNLTKVLPIEVKLPNSLLDPTNSNRCISAAHPGISSSPAEKLATSGVEWAAKLNSATSGK
jgi:hypothetical protein